MKRFSNPHLSVQHIKLSSRSEIFAVEEDEPVPELSSLIGQLDELVQKSLDTTVTFDDSRSRKRRKLNTEESETQETSLFRLVSNTIPPLPVSLDPKPLPPSITREPDYEDNEADAAKRMYRAQASAVSSDWVFQESNKVFQPFHRSDKKLEHVKAQVPNPAPCMMITECRKPPRKTRPPVPISLLNQYPYVADAAIPSSSLGFSGKNMHCPVLNVDFVSEQKTRKRKRIRGKSSKRKERPQPVFWRPNPALGGKSAGYAMGYPSSWSAYEDVQHGRHYTRDTMRKAVHADGLRTL